MDDTDGISAVYVQINYDPMVLVLTSVEPGELKEVFTADFITTEVPGSIAIVAYEHRNVGAQQGVLAYLNFSVREGADALYSDLTLADVQIKEETFTKDLTLETPLTPKNAMVRSFSMDADCKDRLAEGYACVADETQLANLTLQEGDVLAVSDRQTPIVVTETLTVEGALKLRAPRKGWTGQRYEVLKSSNTEVVFDEATIPKEYMLSIESSDGVVTYVLTSTAVDPVIPIQSMVPLSNADQDGIRQLLATQLEGVTAITVNGTLEAIQVGLDLGIRPSIRPKSRTATEAEGQTLVVDFALPTLKIIDFDLKAGRVVVQILPAEGAVIAKTAMTGVLHLHGSQTLSESMAEISLASDAIDLSGYLDENQKGIVRFTVQLGDYSFFKVVVQRLDDIH
jgi:hypothetical protein